MSLMDPFRDKMPPHVKAQLVATVRHEKDRCKARRAAILASKDACVAMTEPPLSFPTAETWNGYLPPKYVYRDGFSDALVRNHTPRRNALAALLEAIGYHEEGF